MVKVTNTSAACDHKFVVYALHRAATDSVIYIGKGLRKRPLVHERMSRKGTHYNNHLMNVINKDLRNGYGPPAIIIIKGNLSENEAFILEKQLIAEIGRSDLKTGPLLNKSDGGDGPSGHLPPPEAVERIASFWRGRKMTPEDIERCVAPRRGVKRPNSGKAISAAKKGRPLSETGREGIRKAARSIERRAKLSKAFKGRKFSDETKAKMSLAAKARTDRKRGCDGKYCYHG